MILWSRTCSRLPKVSFFLKSETATLSQLCYSHLQRKALLDSLLVRCEFLVTVLTLKIRYMILIVSE